MTLQLIPPNILKMARTFLSMVVLLSCLLLNTEAQATRNCTFPRVLNIDGDISKDHAWRFLSPDLTYNKPHKTGQWNIHATSAYVSHGNSLNDYDSADGYDLDCLENVGADKVLVRRVDVDGTDRFTCIQFIKRSAIVVQVRLAEYAPTAESVLCDEDHLQQNDTTLVHFHPPTWQEVLDTVPYMSCSLDGGFIIKQWLDDQQKEGCVPDVTNALRIEDDCDRGSGLHIIGESKKCPSPLDIYKEPLMCIASWDDGDYTFSVATDEWNNFFVCLRIPKQRGKGFTVEIFMDGICDSSPGIDRSTSHRKLFLQQFLVSDLCANASPHCPVLGHSECTGNVPNLCRETCSVCPQEKTWLSEDLPKNIQHKWIMKTSTDDAIDIKITNRAIHYPEHITWRYFGPSPCNRTGIGHQKTAKEYTLVSTSANGCLPRIASAMINRFSETVIGLEISRSSPSELEMKNKTAVWSSSMSGMCSKTTYLDDDTRLGDSFHTSSYGWRNLVRPEGNIRLTRCHLFQTEKLDVTLRSGEQCFASMELKPLKDAFDLTIEECGTDNVTTIPGGVNAKVRYECLASFRDSLGWGSYLITRTRALVPSLVNETFLCWYLNERREGFLMPVSDCNDNTPSHISLDEKQPLATLRFSTVPPTVPSASSTPALTSGIGMVLTLLLVLSLHV